MAPTMTDNKKQKKLNKSNTLATDGSNSMELGSPSMKNNGGETTAGDNVRNLCEQGQNAIVAGMKAANAMPSGRSRDLYAAHPEFIKIMDTRANQVLNIISNILQMQGVQGNILQRDPDERLEMVHDFNDNILERIHSNLDEMAGIRKTAPTVLVQSEVQVPVVPRYRLSGAWNEKQTREPVKATLITGINIARPQAKFKVPIDNSRINPFVPIIRDKPNSLKPLAVLPEYDSEGNIVSYLHPYEFELDRFQPSRNVFQRVTPQEPPLLEKTPLTFIDKVSQLAELMRDLKSANEIAIDLEHHSYRSYQGFTCLMQLSTRSKDYIVDALALRDELHVLNEVFTDPKKLKVLHGSINDIEWLQRDLGLYLVNMFDTGEAARVLQLSRIGLQFLLKHYCNIDTDKAFQLADWRIRPIPDNFIEYARKDTHYLLYIYDRMKNELLDKGEGMLQTVFDKSTFICKQRYQKPVLNEDTVMNIYRRSRYVFDHRQMYAFREILYWRDQMARLEDESAGYVLPQHMAFDIASKLPREMQGIIACCTPVPSLVRQHLHTLHQIILKARDLPSIVAEQSTHTKEQHADTRYKMQTAFDFDNPLVCPHDSAGHTEAAGGTNHPTLLGDLTNTLNAVTLMPQFDSNLLKDAPDLGIFALSKIQTIDSRGRVGLNENEVSKEKYAKLLALHTNDPQTQTGIVSKYERNKFNTPFERYQETCRLRQLKERKDENLQKGQQQSAVKQNPDESNQSELQSSFSSSGAIQPSPATVVVVKEESATPQQIQPHLMTQNQLKRLEEKNTRKAIATGEKLRFDGTTVMERPSTVTNQSPHGKRKSFPMEINVSGSGETIEQNLVAEATKKEKPNMAPYKDESKSDAHNESANWNEKRAKTRKAKQRHRNLMKSSIGQGSHQSSNKPIVPFDYNSVDFSRFQGGSKPLAAPRKGKRGGAVGHLTLASDAGESSGIMKKLHPNSRIAKNIKQTQKLFNLSSSSMKRK
ncbi:exosome component 10 [Anopheles maculipalpis]|uniref:exosome component 10 n=1 Tax=Anopheles maculipalpis TaxID=1496333 RepID=UPI0021592599|nr:exosome component 10 [Anopheles maculipalpis]